MTDDRGSAAVVAVVVAALLGVLACVAASLAGLVVAQRRAAAAADLAALAGATSVRSARDPCTPARVVAERNGGQLARCVVTGSEVTVTVTRGVSPWFGPEFDVHSDARAGPG